MRAPLVLSLVVAPLFATAANCVNQAPPYEPITETFERTCKKGELVVDVKTAKSPVVKLNFGKAQEITVSTHSGAKSTGGNGKDAQVCIWQSWDATKPCGRSDVSQDGFNDWDGKATCSVNAPAGVQYIRAMQYNQNADEMNTTIVIRCR